MAAVAKISVCIPAFKRIEFLQRVLESLAIQTFRDFEVIVTDDSPDQCVEELVSAFENRLPKLIYYRNESPLGTPANWNKAISLARGEWIKLLHDDDWLAHPESLEIYAGAAENNPGSFIYSDYIDVFLDSKKEKKRRPSSYRRRQLKKEPASILSKNIIGPPSVVLYPNDRKHLYDESLKWLVDVDMYIRRLPDSKIFHLPRPLVKVGVGSDQVTSFTHGVAAVEVPEHLHFIGKLSPKVFNNILVYDYWWRFTRNFQLSRQEKVSSAAIAWPPVVNRMIRSQARIWPPLLKFGPLSKLLMAIHFLINRKKMAF